MGIVFFIITIVFFLLTAFSDPIVDVITKHSKLKKHEENTEGQTTEKVEPNVATSKEEIIVIDMPSTDKKDETNDLNDTREEIIGITTYTTPFLGKSIISGKKLSISGHRPTIIKGYPIKRARQMAIKKSKRVHINNNSKNVKSYINRTNKMDK